MRYILAWPYVPRPVLSDHFVFSPTTRLIAMAIPEAVDEDAAFKQTMEWLKARSARSSKKAVVTGIASVADPSNPDLPANLPCTNCRSSNTRLGSVKVSKNGEQDVHTWTCLDAVNCTRNSMFPCEACTVCHHSLELWDHLYHHCDKMKAAGEPPVFLRPNYDHRKVKNDVCEYCNGGPNNVMCKCK